MQLLHAYSPPCLGLMHSHGGLLISALTCAALLLNKSTGCYLHLRQQQKTAARSTRQPAPRNAQPDSGRITLVQQGRTVLQCSRRKGHSAYVAPWHRDVRRRQTVRHPSVGTALQMLGRLPCGTGRHTLSLLSRSLSLCPSACNLDSCARRGPLLPRGCCCPIRLQQPAGPAHAAWPPS